MSILERLQKGPMDRERRFLHRHESDSLERIKLSKGMDFLTESGMLNKINEMRIELEKEFLDVESYGVESSDDGEVYVGLQWNFRREERRGENVPVCSSFEVSTRRDANEFAVITGEGREILDESQWRNEDILDDVFAQGYKNPYASFLVKEYRDMLERELAGKNTILNA